MRRKDIIVVTLLMMMAFYVANRLAWLYGYCNGASTAQRLATLFIHMEKAFAPYLSFWGTDILAGVAAAILVAGGYVLKQADKKKFRKGEEYGSARWGTHKDIIPFMDTVNSDNNILLTQTESLRICGRPKLPKYDRNKNVLVIGGSGDGGIIVISQAKTA